MFKLEDNVVYPGHGVAIIDEIITKQLGNKKVELFKLKFLYKDMTILLPKDNANACGIRHLSEKLVVKKVFDGLYKKTEKRSEYLDFTPSGWNRRNKDYQLKLQSGNIIDVADVYRDLMCIAQQKELSFGEKKILLLAESLLYQEIRVVTGQSHATVLDQLHAPFRQFLFQQTNVKQFSSAV